MEILKIFTPCPILGYGFDLDDFWHVVQTENPAAIIVDAGSTDPGPFMLGSGKTLCSRESYIRDLTPMIQACSRHDIKLLVSSAGGAGTNGQVDYMVSILERLAQNEGVHLRVATIKFNGSRDSFKTALARNQIESCGPSPQLKKQDIENATAIVAQMGVEPFRQALKDDKVDIIIAGRSYDPAPFAAFCLHHGVSESTAWHVGKIIECGGLCTKPKGRSILAKIYKDSFDLIPVSRGERCTPLSVAAHTMYEKTRPDRLPGPGGVLHLDHVTYTQLPDKASVNVKGSHFVPTPVYQVKLEGAEMIGYRTTYIGGIRDPILVDNIDEFLIAVTRTTRHAFPDLGNDQGPQLQFHIYGKNAVMGSLEFAKTTSHEIGVLGEVIAHTQDIANAIAGFSRTVLLHAAYEGQLATAGNYASPLTPLEQALGPVYKFSIYHLMEVDDPTSLFPVQTLTMGTTPNGVKHSLRNSAKVKSGLGVRNSEKTGLKVVKTGVSTDELVSNIPSSQAVTIRDLASVVRSKNSGPFEITLDILFDKRLDFERVKMSGVLNVDTIKKLYHLSDEDILVLMFYEPALGWKCTFKRPWLQGSFGERDTFGAQQHAPLLSVQVPSLKSSL